MPYIEDTVTKEYPHGKRYTFEPVRLSFDSTVGDLNFQITKLIDFWLQDNQVSYFTLNSAIGVLECAKLELYRRIAAPYEDMKIEENGDVYECLTKTLTE